MRGRRMGSKGYAWMAGILAALLAGPAVAAKIDFQGSGTVAPTGCADPSGNLPLFASGNYTFNGAGGWTLASPFTFNLVSGVGSGTFNFNGAFGDSLFGSLTSTGTPGRLRAAIRNHGWNGPVCRRDRMGQLGRDAAGRSPTGRRRHTSRAALSMSPSPGTARAAGSCLAGLGDDAAPPFMHDTSRNAVRYLNVGDCDGEQCSACRRRRRVRP